MLPHARPYTVLPFGLKTAKALGLTMLPGLLQRVD
jgi:hypothetical protein